VTATSAPAVPPLALASVPVFWPLALAGAMLGQGAALLARNLKFVEEDLHIHRGLRPRLATPHVTRLELRTMRLLDYGVPGGVPVLVVAPYAGHTAMIADYHRGQSLVQTLLDSGIGHVALTDWRSATVDMKEFDIDNYLAEVVVAIDDLGGVVKLVGLCQGGWLAAMVAARFPAKVSALVLAGAPIDTDAGTNPLTAAVHGSPLSFFRDLVALGGGLMRGKLMLQGWKSMHPEQHYMQSHVELYEHIDDPAYLDKQETFESWYENPIDLPGRWYLQVIEQLFQQNRLAKGQFVALGRAISLRAIACPACLLAGADDDITAPEQVLGAAGLLGTAPGDVYCRTVAGGHVGLFMGARTLAVDWPVIARWLQDHPRGPAGGPP
jgi:polyhydroxyalkanoate depolymerase